MVDDSDSRSRKQLQDVFSAAGRLVAGALLVGHTESRSMHWPVLTDIDTARAIGAFLATCAAKCCTFSSELDIDPDIMWGGLQSVQLSFGSGGTFTLLIPSAAEVAALPNDAGEIEGSN